LNHKIDNIVSSIANKSNSNTDKVKNEEKHPRNIKEDMLKISSSFYTEKNKNENILLSKDFIKETNKTNNNNIIEKLHNSTSFTNILNHQQRMDNDERDLQIKQTSSNLLKNFYESDGASLSLQESRSMTGESSEDQKAKLEKAYLQIPSSTCKNLSVNLSRLPFNSLNDLNSPSVNVCIDCLTEEKTKKCSSSTSCFTILNDQNDSIGLLSDDSKKHKVSSMVSIKARCDAATHIKSLPQSPTTSESSRHHHHHHHHSHQHHHHSGHRQCKHHHQHHNQNKKSDSIRITENVSKSCKSLNKASTSPNKLSPLGQLEIKSSNSKNELSLSTNNNNNNINSIQNTSFYSASNDGDSSSMTNSNSNSLCCSRCVSPCCLMHGNSAGNFSYSVSDLYAGSLTDSINHILNIPLMDAKFTSADFLIKTFDNYAMRGADDSVSYSKLFDNLEENTVNEQNIKYSRNLSKKISSKFKKAVKFQHEEKSSQDPSKQTKQFMKHANSSGLIFDLSQNLNVLNLGKTNINKSDFITQRTQSFLDLHSLSKKCNQSHRTHKHRYKFINIHRNRHIHKHPNLQLQINNVRIPKNDSQNYKRLFGSL
jgi:hypothetical protein